MKEDSMAVKGIESGKRIALLISEMQNGIVDPAHVETPLALQVSERGIIPRINTLAAAFRDRGLPVIHCTISARPEFQAWNVNCVIAARIQKAGKLIQESHFAAIHDDIVVAKSDMISDRHHGMAAFT